MCLLQIHSLARLERVDGHLADLTNTPPFGGYLVFSMYSLMPQSNSNCQQYSSHSYDQCGVLWRGDSDRL
jgi:hypothetical protein